MPTKRTIKAEAVSQPEVLAPLTVKAVKATKTPKAKAAAAPARNNAATKASTVSKAAPAKGKAPKAVAKALKAAPEVVSESPLSSVTTAAAATGEALIATHSVPTEMVSLTALSDEISRVAYQLWMEGGCQHGRALDDWARAENLVKSRYGL